MQTERTYFATCKLGLESVVADELKALDINVIRKEDARVFFTATDYDLARACIWLRTAERVMLFITSFKAVTFTELFDKTFESNLKPYFMRNSFIHVVGKSAKSTLFSVSDCQSIVKKAIVENLRRAFGVTVLPENGNRVIIEVGILNDEVTLSLDACGAGLSRRGYRLHNYTAPISETLGAAIVLLSHYKPELPFIDPMCGSGTLPIEAAMIADNIAVGRNRSFASEEWHFLDSGVFDEAKSNAADSVIRNNHIITGSDIDPSAIDLCKKHAKNAGVQIKWSTGDVRSIKIDSEQSPRGVLACNPPYGERMMTANDTERLYRDMSKTFSKLPVGWSVNIITSHPRFEFIYGQRADKRRNLSNGGKRCTLYSYTPWRRNGKSK